MDRSMLYTLAQGQCVRCTAPGNEVNVMYDDMFFTNDNKSLRRGKRRAQRTETCRPCIIWPTDAPELTYQCVAININPYGMLVRMMDSLPPGTSVSVQLMRDEGFAEPLTAPLEGMIVRTAIGDDEFYDHGVQIDQRQIERQEIKPMKLPKRERPRTTRTSRMHTIDIRLGGSRSRREER